MPTILQTRERLLARLRHSESVGDLDTAALLEYGIAEFDGVLALLTSMSEPTRATMH